MTRRDRIPDSDLAELGNAYGPLSPQRQWDSIAQDDPETWWAGLVLSIVIFVLGAVAGTVLYVLVLGWS